MAVVAITGGPGAPGATSAALALLLGWPLTDSRRVLLVEADPDGGAVLAGALQGEVQADKGLRNLALSDRRGRLLEEMWDQCIDVSPQGTGDRLLLPGLTDPAQAAALVYTWEPLAEACDTLDGYGCDVIVDLGRSGGHGPSAVLARRADAVLAVLRTTLRGLSTARPRVAALTAELARDGAADTPALLLIREGPYAAAEVSRALGVPVVGLLPFAPKEARVLSDGGGRTDRRFQRSELMRAARSTADELRALTARRRLLGRPPTTAPEPRPEAARIPAWQPGVASGLPTAPPTPTPSPLRVVPAAAPVPATPPIPPAAAAGASPLGYRQAQAPAVSDQPPAPATWPVHEVPLPPSASHPGPGLSTTPAAWTAHDSQPPVPVDPTPRPWSAHAATASGPAIPHPYGEVRGPSLGLAPPAPGMEAAWPPRDVSAPGPLPLSDSVPPGFGDAAAAAGHPAEGHPTIRPGHGSGAESAPEAWSLREVMDLAAAAELGARPVAPGGPGKSPIGPVTPGQAARLQAVHLEAGRMELERGALNPPHMVAMPPLAEHAPRPPAPGELRPAEDGEHGGGEVARVR